MKKIPTVAAVVLAWCAPAVVMAQAGFGPPSGPPPGAMPLPTVVTTPALTAQLPGVDQELKLEPTQRDRIGAIAETERKDLDAALRKTMGGGPPVGGMNRTVMHQSLRKAAEQVGKKSGVALDRVMRPEQTTRLTQLQRQYEGAFAFERTDVVEALQLSAEQRRAIAVILNDASPIGPDRNLPVPGAGAPGIPNRPQNLASGPRNAPPGPPGNPNGPPAQVGREEAAQSRERITALLSDAQKRKWGELIGERYDFDNDRR